MAKQTPRASQDDAGATSRVGVTEPAAAEAAVESTSTADAAAAAAASDVTVGVTEPAAAEALSLTGGAFAIGDAPAAPEGMTTVYGTLPDYADDSPEALVEYWYQQTNPRAWRTPSAAERRAKALLVDLVRQYVGRLSPPAAA